MKILLRFLLLLLIWQYPCLGQNPFSFNPVSDIPVIMDDQSLPLAWSGGLNSGQYYSMDLNQDQEADLVIFDRTTDKVNTFIKVAGQYQYQPRYEYLFPQDLNSWMVLADYDCDGKKDIFANTTFGLKVYRNITLNQLSFQLVEDPLQSENNGLLVNLQVSSSDIPAVTDVDGDGDLDILVFNFAVGGVVEYHKNLSLETDGTCNNLNFRLETNRWGDFEECDCDEFVFGGSCNNPGGKAAHAGGKSILTLDRDHDGDLELIFGDEFCENITLLENQGDADQADFNTASAEFPNDQNPVSFFIFPALYQLDVNDDGHTDLIAAPNLFQNLNRQVNFRQSSHLYLNEGLTDQESFQYVTDDWLQGDMLDFGEAAALVFLDFDGDLDQDMLVGSRGIVQDGSSFYATLHLFENTGGPGNPSFELTNPDFLNLSSSQLQSIKPSWADLNGDGWNDLVFAAAAVNGQTSIHYILNQSGQAFDPISNQPEILNFIIDSGDHPHFKDFNGDGWADLLLGKRTGRLEYWENQASGDLIFDLVDEQLAGIGDDSFRRELVPWSQDLNQDGDLELVTIDATGVMRIYENFLDDKPEVVQNFTELIRFEEGQPKLLSRLGRNSTITGAQLGTGLPYLIIGSNQGGLLLLENHSDISPNAPGAGTLELLIQPNPNPGRLKLSANRPFSWVMYNAQGQAIRKSPPAPLFTHFLDASDLADGIYVVRGISVDGVTEARRMLVLR